MERADDEGFTPREGGRVRSEGRSTPCLDRATQGHYTLDGVDVSHRDFDDLAEVRNEKIGFIFQNFNLIPVLDVAENIEFPIAVRKNAESPEALRKRVLELAKEVGLDRFLHHKPDELSGGQRQRVAARRAPTAGTRANSETRAISRTTGLRSFTAALILHLGEARGASPHPRGLVGEQSSEDLRERGPLRRAGRADLCLKRRSSSTNRGAVRGLERAGGLWLAPIPPRGPASSDRAPIYGPRAPRTTNSSSAFCRWSRFSASSHTAL